MATTFEFYKVSFDKEEPSINKSIEDYFSTLINKSIGFKGDFDRDIYDFKKVQNKYYGGIFRKIRTDEIIETGKVGTPGKQVPYTKGEGKLETNHLVYFPEFDVICYVRNIHANHFKRLEKCLSEAFNRRILLSPLITQGALNSLLNNKHVVKIDVSVPINASQLSNNGQLWSDEAMSAAAKSGSDVLKLQANIDLRSNKGGKIKEAYSNIKNLLSNNATRAVVHLEDIDGNISPIDLISDKIVFKDESFAYTKDANISSYIYDKIVDAYLGKLDEITKVC